MPFRITLPNRIRSLRAQVILRIVLPVFLISTGMVLAGNYAYNRIITSLIIERHHQLAEFAAASVSERVGEYADLLEVLAAKTGVLSQLPEERALAVREAEELSNTFSAGILVADQNGALIPVLEENPAASIDHAPASKVFQSARDTLKPVYSNVLETEQTGHEYVLVAVPIVDNESEFAGAVIGAIDLRSAIIKSIRELTIGKDGITYLTDGDGVILAHPDPQQIGLSRSNRFYIDPGASRQNGGLLVDSATGHRLVESHAPIGMTGWRVVVQESWDSVMEPVRSLGILVGLASLVTITLVVILLWNGLARITEPIQALKVQTEKLAKVENIEPIKDSGIAEIDSLEIAFLKMAEQISSYRSGLRRYVGAITKSQEEERRRVARELHDDTIQSLLVVLRRLELYKTSGASPEHQDKLHEIQGMLSRILEGIRLINRDLRPLILEDLGLVPALQSLVRAARQGEGAVPHVKFTVSGEYFPLNPEQELALYRITQEALTNIRKHARASGVLVEISFQDKAVELGVSDDGKGFKVPQSLMDFARNDCFGLIGLQERVWAAGGELSVRSSPGMGTRLTVKIPV
jgi:two-component system, NarL family, sensor histidine kinase UhpB